MDSRLQFLGQNVVDPAMTLQAGGADECLCNDLDAKMGAGRTIEGDAMIVPVAGMQMALIDDVEALGRQGIAQFAFDPGLNGHEPFLSPYRACWPYGRGHRKKVGDSAVRANIP